MTITTVVCSLAVQAVENLHHLVAHLAVEVPGRLIGEEDAGAANDRAGDRDALLLAARELGREVTGSRDERPTRSSAASAAAGARDAPSADKQRQLDVVDHREIAQQVELLKDEADLAVAQPGQRAVAMAVDPRAVELDLARARLVEQADEIEQRALAAARRAHHRNKLALGDVEIDVVERRRLDPLGAVQLAHLPA